MRYLFCVLMILACGGKDQNPQAGHYAGTLVLSSPGKTSDIHCSIDFNIPELPGQGGEMGMNCSGTALRGYSGHAFLIQGYLSFDLDAKLYQFVSGLESTDTNCELISYNPDQPAGKLTGGVEGCGVIGRLYSTRD